MLSGILKSFAELALSIIEEPKSPFIFARLAGLAFFVCFSLTILLFFFQVALEDKSEILLRTFLICGLISASLLAVAGIYMRTDRALLSNRPGVRVTVPSDSDRMENKESSKWLICAAVVIAIIVSYVSWDPFANSRSGYDDDRRKYEEREYNPETG